jgi:predicted transposase/invertase (TIGR01784 family)
MSYLPFLFSPEDDIIDICWDNVFKAAFTRDTPSSQAALKNLIAAFIGHKVELLSVLAHEPPITALQDRQIRYDIRVRFDQGALANIEMTLNPRGFETLRLEYYAARLYSGQDIRGADKNFGDLRATYQIALVGRKRLFGDEGLVHHFRYYDREHGVDLGGRTEIIVVELEKAEGLLGRSAGEMTAGERWALFFRYVTDRGKRGLMNELLAYEEGIGMAGEILLTISKDEGELARLESEYKYQLDHQSEMVTARREGEQIGMEKGLRETARKLKAMGLIPEQIAEATGLNPKDLP